jgi:hypothetical protein
VSQKPVCERSTLREGLSLGLWEVNLGHRCYQCGYQIDFVPQGPCRGCGELNTYVEQQEPARQSPRSPPKPAAAPPASSKSAPPGSAAAAKSQASGTSSPIDVWIAIAGAALGLYLGIQFAPENGWVIFFLCAAGAGLAWQFRKAVKVLAIVGIAGVVVYALYTANR